MTIPACLRNAAVFLLSAVLFACTPKVTEPATQRDDQPTTVSRPAAPGEELSPCDKFSDTRNPDQAETDYVIYRNLLKADETEAAFKQWRKVYANSPAADGRRSTVFRDGITFYNNLIQEYPDRQAAYGDTLLMIYNKARECYPGNGYMSAIQAFDSYYKYPGSATDEEIWELFRESIELDGPDGLQYFVINPMSGLTVKLHRAGEITDEQAKEVVPALQYRLEKGLNECSGSGCEAWKLIEAYTPDALRYFETVEGFYDCAYYTEQYYQNYLDNPEDCDAIQAAYSRMNFGGCDKESEQMQGIRAAYVANCREPVEPGVTEGSWQALVRDAYRLYQDGKPRQAVEKFEEAIPLIPEDRRGKYQMLTAKIYYRDLRNFSQARGMARDAARSDPSSGEPYMLIGTLYASSGPLCGPGTGFDSQVVTWPAIDKWQQAKRIDPSVAAEANRLIGRYTQYMPSKSDVFQRGLKEGDSFTVGCWINETTRIRTP